MRANTRRRIALTTRRHLPTTRYRRVNDQSHHTIEIHHVVSARVARIPSWGTSSVVVDPYRLNKVALIERLNPTSKCPRLSHLGDHHVARPRPPAACHPRV